MQHRLLMLFLPHLQSVQARHSALCIMNLHNRDAKNPELDTLTMQGHAFARVKNDFDKAPKDTGLPLFLWFALLANMFARKTAASAFTI